VTCDTRIRLQNAWKQIFGLNSTNVEILEAMRCFKCDISGLAIICKIRLKDKTMTVRDLVGNGGLITNIEVLYKEKDGSLVVFIEGRPCIPRLGNDIPAPKLLMAKPPDFLDTNRMKVELIGNEKDIKNSSHK
jgi:hypothetical protein